MYRSVGEVAFVKRDVVRVTSNHDLNETGGRTAMATWHRSFLNSKYICRARRSQPYKVLMCATI